MPNIKSAEKRVEVAKKKRLQNQMIKSQMATAIKKFNAAVGASDTELATSLLPKASAAIDKAAKTGAISKNAANRKKAQIGRSLHLLKSGIITVKVDAKTKKQQEQKAAAVAKAAAFKANLEAKKAEKAAKEAEKNAAKAKPSKTKKETKTKNAKEEVVAEVAAEEAAIEAPKKEAKAKKPKAE